MIIFIIYLKKQTPNYEPLYYINSYLSSENLKKNQNKYEANIYPYRHLSR